MATHFTSQNWLLVTKRGLAPAVSYKTRHHSPSTTRARRRRVPSLSQALGTRYCVLRGWTRRSIVAGDSAIGLHRSASRKNLRRPGNPKATHVEFVRQMSGHLCPGTIRTKKLHPLLPKFYQLPPANKSLHRLGNQRQCYAPLTTPVVSSEFASLANVGKLTFQNQHFVTPCPNAICKFSARSISRDCQIAKQRVASILWQNCSSPIARRSLSSGTPKRHWKPLTVVVAEFHKSRMDCATWQRRA
jgi:hypothetical protein